MLVYLYQTLFLIDVFANTQLNKINGYSDLSDWVKWDSYPHVASYPLAVAEQSEIYARHNSLPKRRTSWSGCQSENGQVRAGTLGRQDLINRYHLTQPEKQNMSFELLEHTITTLARFFQIEEASTGVEKLMSQLYKIKNKIENSWVDVLNLRAVMVVFFNS